MLAQLLSDHGPTIATVIVTVGAHYLALRDRLVRIETKLDIHDKDLDGFGRLLETERSKSKAP